ncbi:MAG: sugar phosphate isomerase/epimerase [Treponema sp.]|nr:sugar phosphate isomerase/epimerase [Treponema sp.]
MAKMKAGFIGLMPRDAPDPLVILESYAKAGFKGAEGAGFFFRENPADGAKKLKEMGLEPLTVGYGSRPGSGPPTVEQLIENCNTWGVKRVASFGGILMAPRFGGGEWPDYDAIMKEIETFEEVAKGLAKEGIRFTFHNHDVEFTQTYNGVPAFWLMAAHSEHICFQVDVGWAMYGGEDPIRLMKTLGKRCTDIHIKDYAPGEVVQDRPNDVKVIMPRFTTPGTGVLDLAGCLKQASELGIEWAVIEQDFQYNLSQYETIQAAYLNMKETGFVE